jgi:hypothetical protein
MSILTTLFYIEFANNSFYIIGKDVGVYLVKNTIGKVGWHNLMFKRW